MPRRDQEIRSLARVELGLALLATAEQIEPGRPEPALEIGDERERVGRQDPVRTRDVATPQLDPVRQCHHRQTSPRRTVASMSPCGSVVATYTSRSLVNPNGDRSTSQ